MVLKMHFQPQNVPYRVLAEATQNIFATLAKVWMRCFGNASLGYFSTIGS